MNSRSSLSQGHTEYYHCRNLYSDFVIQVIQSQAGSNAAQSSSDITDVEFLQNCQIFKKRNFSGRGNILCRQLSPNQHSIFYSTVAKRICPQKKQELHRVIIPFSSPPDCSLQPKDFRNQSSKSQQIFLLHLWSPLEPMITIIRQSALQQEVLQFIYKFNKQPSPFASFLLSVF